MNESELAAVTAGFPLGPKLLKIPVLFIDIFDYHYPHL